MNNTAARLPARASDHGADGGTDEFRSRREVIPFDGSAEEGVGQFLLDGRIVLSEYRPSGLPPYAG